MAPIDDDVIARALRVLESARIDRADANDLAEAAIGLQLLRERLLKLLAFPTFPDQGQGIVRLGSVDSLPPKQRQAYSDVKGMLGIG